ncbi:MAG: ribosomal protein S18-alanine N-acetyltransferase [Pseudomonadota bacterium]
MHHSQDIKITVIGKTEPEAADKLCALHQNSFTNGWSQGSFLKFLQNENALIFGATKAKTTQLVGFIVLQTVIDQAEILTLTVCPNHKRQGIATALCETACEHLKKINIHTLFLEVDDTNVAAVMLYEKLGFQNIGRRKGYYKKQHISTFNDAIMMQYKF